MKAGPPPGATVRFIANVDVISKGLFIIRTKLMYGKAGNLPAVQLLLGHSKIDGKN